MQLEALWVVGFVDGEGCFHVSVNAHPEMSVGYQVLPEFTVVQHRRDIQILHALKGFFDCGVVRTTRTLLAQPAHSVADVDVWVRLNEEFHRLLIADGDITLVGELVQRIGQVPLASAALVPTMGDNVPVVFDYVADAVRMHGYVFDAIVRREPARAHNLMLEHVHQGRMRMMSFIESWPDGETPTGFPAVER